MPDQPNEGGSGPTEAPGSAAAGDPTVEMTAPGPQQQALPLDDQMLVRAPQQRDQHIALFPQPSAASSAPASTSATSAPASPSLSSAPASRSESGAHAAVRRSGWSTVLVVAGVTMLVAGAGVAGVYAGRMTSPAPGVVVQAEVPPVEEEEEELVASPAMAVGPLPVPAPGTLVVTTARVPVSTWAVVLNGTAALSDDSGSAPGYRLVNQGISGAQVAGIIATTFGVSGAAVATDTGWEVGVAGGPRVIVVDDPLFSWTYDDPAAALPPAVDPAASPSPSDDPAASPPADAVFAPVDAIAAATETLTSIGVDLTSVEYEVGTADGRTVVSAWQVVAEQRTQLGWRMVFDPDGSIVAASGFSSGFQAVPDYPVVGAATAVERSRQTPWTSIPASPISGPTDESEMPSAPAPNASGVPSVDLPVSEVDVLSAELGLAQYWQPDGSILLLPSYILTGADGSTWSLLAVAESAVRFVIQPYPIDGEQRGFVPEPFPSPTLDEDADDLADSGADDAATPAPPLQDDGMVDENGNPIAPPTEDPAAGE